MSGDPSALRELAKYAPNYQTEVFDKYPDLVGVGSRPALLDANPVTALAFFYALPAFNRSGAPRAYRSFAITALDDTSSSRKIDTARFWETFQEICRDQGYGVNEKMNRGVIVEGADLANRRGNLYDWVHREVSTTGRLQPLYEEVVDITGIGENLAMFFLRDAIWVADIESKVGEGGHFYLQPTTAPIKECAKGIWPGRNNHDHGLAAELTKFCLNEGVSPIEFNQGAWYFTRFVTDSKSDIAREVEKL